MVGGDKAMSFDRMNEQQKLACLEMQSDHLAVFATDFRNHMIRILSHLSLLESDNAGETELSQEEKERLFKMVISAVRAYIEYSEQSARERQAFMREFSDEGDE